MIVGRFTTLTAVRRELGIADATTTDDDLLANLIQRASDDIHALTQRTFVPYRYSYEAGIDERTDAYTLDVRADILGLVSVTNADSTSVSSSDYDVLPRNVYPRWRVRLRQSASILWQYDEWHDVVTLAGFFGFHEDYPRAWKSTDTLQLAIADATTTTVKVSNAALFEVGDYIRIGTTTDYEIMRVTARTTASTPDELTVERGDMGTTAASSYSLSTAVYVYQQAPAIKLAATRAAVWLYKNRNAQRAVYETMSGQIQIATELKDEYSRIKRYERQRIHGFL
jgi:hypothetical protein